MKKNIAHSFISLKTKDEFYTPKLLVEPIIKHLDIWRNKFINEHKRETIILCPFDTDTSEFVLALKQYKIKFGHITTGQDFFKYDYGNYDIVISNMPFSLKLEIMEKLFNENKSFALICNIMSLNYLCIADVFRKYSLQLLGFNKRVSYNGKIPTFASGYYCYKFLEKDLIFEGLPHSNSGKNFTPSRMKI